MADIAFPAPCGWVKSSLRFLLLSFLNPQNTIPRDREMGTNILHTVSVLLGAVFISCQRSRGRSQYLQLAHCRCYLPDAATELLCSRGPCRIPEPQSRNGVSLMHRLSVELCWPACLMRRLAATDTASPLEGRYKDTILKEAMQIRNPTQDSSCTPQVVFLSPLLDSIVLRARGRGN